MCVDVTALPQDVLGYIFSYLNPGDLGQAAQVCRSWNATSKLDWIWQNSVRSILDLSVPLQGSWKKQCQILGCWRTWKSQEIPLFLSPLFSINGKVYVLLEDGAVFEMVCPDSTRRSLFSVRNLLDNREVTRIDIKQFGCSNDFWEAMHEAIWTIRDRDGKIFQFDITTGNCINQFIGESVLGRVASALYSNDHEIISSVENRVQVWDLQQRRLSQSFRIEEGQDIQKLCSTPNFVLCLSRKTDSLSIIAINKKDPTIQTRIEVGTDTCLHTFKSSGSYCAFLAHNRGELRVYEETPDVQFQLARTHPIQGSSAPSSFSPMDWDSLWNESVQMYKNWVCVQKDDTLYIFDVRNGKKILLLKRDWDTDFDFRVNARALLAFHITVKTGSVTKPSNPRLYDFSGRVRQIPLSS